MLGEGTEMNFFFFFFLLCVTHALGSILVLENFTSHHVKLL